MIRRLRFARRINPVIVQLLAAVVAGIAVVGIGLGSLLVTHVQARQSAEHSRAALLASQIDGTVNQIAQQPVDIRPGADGGPRPAALAAFIESHDRLKQAEANALELHRLVGSESTLAILGAVEDARHALDTYLTGPTTGESEEFLSHVKVLNALTAREGASLSALADSDYATVESVTRWAYVATSATMVLAGLVVGGTSWLVGRRLSQALAQARFEKAGMLENTLTLERRNSQFEALYHVVNEVSEMLSMQHVVNTAIREARKLMRADVVDLRLLRGSELVLAGTVQDVDADVMGLSAVPLGAGLTGRAARQGKCIRIDDDVEDRMALEEHILGAQSGIVVPLIVGARVVGTLSCWSRQPALFTPEDERVLEMMASQVATALAAADTYEATERDARHDALTSLANRRQLDADLADRLAPALARGEKVAIAMLDIDHFKRFNDRFGHDVGDEALRAVAGAIRGALRTEDSTYRYGGEEFTAVIQVGSQEAVVGLLERVRAAVGELKLRTADGHAVGPVTVSIGLAIGPDDSSDPGVLLRLADRALLHAKRSGRNRVTRYSSAVEDIPEAA